MSFAKNMTYLLGALFILSACSRSGDAISSPDQNPESKDGKIYLNEIPVNSKITFQTDILNKKFERRQVERFMSGNQSAACDIRKVEIKAISGVIHSSGSLQIKKGDNFLLIKNTLDITLSDTDGFEASHNLIFKSTAAVPTLIEISCGEGKLATIPYKNGRLSLFEIKKFNGIFGNSFVLQIPSDSKTFPKMTKPASAKSPTYLGSLSLGSQIEILKEQTLPVGYGLDPKETVACTGSDVGDYTKPGRYVLTDIELTEVQELKTKSDSLDSFVLFGSEAHLNLKEVNTKKVGMINCAHLKAGEAKPVSIGDMLEKSPVDSIQILGTPQAWFEFDLGQE